jgi:hypothetical protein
MQKICLTPELENAIVESRKTLSYDDIALKFQLSKAYIYRLLTKKYTKRVSKERFVNTSNLFNVDLPKDTTWLI